MAAVPAEELLAVVAAASAAVVLPTVLEAEVCSLCRGVCDCEESRTDKDPTTGGGGRGGPGGRGGRGGPARGGRGGRGGGRGGAGGMKGGAKVVIVR